MIRLQAAVPATVHDVRDMLQTAIGVEFGTLPPYLYAKFSILPGANAAAVNNLSEIVGQEMIHMCLACNMLNAIGGTPRLKPLTYPTTLPGDIGPPGGKPLTIRLLPFSEAAMAQGMAIEEPEHPIVIPDAKFAATAGPQAVTIGQFYAAVDKALAILPRTDWTPGRNQIVDDQFFPGQLFAINDYADAHRAISIIVSEGEGSPDDPLDFQHEVSHYYRFGEVWRNKVLTKADNPVGYTWGPQPLGVDWKGAYNAIADPSQHDFSQDPEPARLAQEACNRAYTDLVESLQGAVTGEAGALGRAVRAMFDLRMTAIAALQVPLADGVQVAGPSFLYAPRQPGDGR
jgi:hypothetical protein